MQNVVIDFQVNTKEIVDAISLMETLGQVTKEEADNARAQSMATIAARKEERASYALLKKELEGVKQAVDGVGTASERALPKISNSAGIPKARREFDGLTNSINQLTREAPAAAVSMNTFFLSISNNIPMFVDEINKLRAANVELAKSGQPTVSVMKEIGKSFFSWMSLISVAVTLLTFFGGKLVDFIVGTEKATTAQDAFNKSLKTGNEELAGLGKNLEDSRINALEETGNLSKLEADKLRLQNDYNKKYEKTQKEFNAQIKQVDKEYYEAHKKDQEFDLAANNKYLSDRNILIKNRTLALKIIDETYRYDKITADARAHNDEDKGRKAAKDKAVKEKKEEVIDYVALDKAQYDQQIALDKRKYELLQLEASQNFIDGKINYEEYINTIRNLQIASYDEQIHTTQMFGFDILALEKSKNALLVAERKKQSDEDLAWMKEQDAFIENWLKEQNAKKKDVRTPEQVARDEKELQDARFRVAVASADALRSLNQTYLDWEVGKLDEQLANKEITQKQYDDKIKASKQKAAEQDRAFSIFQIGVLTAQAIMSALATPNLAPGAAQALAIAAGITGAAELAAVIATPIPKFAKGTKNAPAGFKWVGEEGPELISTPGGETIMPHGKSLKFAQMFMDNPFPDIPPMALVKGGAFDKREDIFDYKKLGRVIARELQNAPSPALNVVIKNEIGNINYNNLRYG